jgi:hypothetical protein
VVWVKDGAEGIDWVFSTSVHEKRMRCDELQSIMLDLG